MSELCILVVSRLYIDFNFFNKLMSHKLFSHENFMVLLYNQKNSKRVSDLHKDEMCFDHRKNITQPRSLKIPPVQTFN